MNALETRTIRLPDDLAWAMTALRLRNGLEHSEAVTAKICFWEIHAVEQQLMCSIPDEVIAYVVGRMGHAVRHLSDLPRLTARAYGDYDWDVVKHSAKKYVCFDDDGCGNPMCFPRQTKRRRSGEYLILDHDEGMQAKHGMSMLNRLHTELDDADVDLDAPPFDVEVGFFTASPPEAPEPQTDEVFHAKFGSGRIVSRSPGRKGLKLIVEFDDGVTRQLLEEFVEYRF